MLGSQRAGVEGCVESIEFQCPYCERVSKVPRSFAGKQGKCPGCLELLEVPDVDALEPSAPKEPEPVDPGAETAETVIQPLPQPEDDQVDEVEDPVPSGPKAGETIGTPVGGGSEQQVRITPDSVERSAEQDRNDRRPCPNCGEAIKRVAKKCRFCGQFLDRELARRRRRPGIGRLALASPGSRFGAWAIDFVMFWGPAIGLGAGGGALVETNSTEAMGIVLFVLTAVHVVFLMSYNWYLIATRGQTIGKRWLGLRIVKDTGAPVDFVTGVLLRSWITGVLGSFVLSWIGCMFWVIDSCMIFGQERRCLHDHIASTRVVEVPGRRGRPSNG